MRLMYSEKGGYMHAYNSHEEARLLADGWTFVADKPAPVAEITELPHVAEEQRRKPGRPKKEA